ncbi:hypothetical protein H9L39_18719 [Fusarium oxysporum f. sp. albedinis]|nr:hypothetical protein H9L39_18719 [Fusarium oxysporum f. sp. albedinis]
MASKPQLKDTSLLIGLNLIEDKKGGNNNEDNQSNVPEKFTDPSTGSLIGSCPESTVQDAQRAISAAAKALPAWRSQPARHRSRIMRRWYDLIIENASDIATILSWENGKAQTDAKAEVISAASFVEWFSEEAVRIYGDIIPHSIPSLRVAVFKQPVGVCGLITPWNFPAGMVTRKLAPALAAGCTAVLKTAGETPFTANALVYLAEQAGIPRGVINIVSAMDNTPEIGQALCASDTIRKISFTGSTRVGRILMKQCSDSIKKMSLELGGNAPLIVFEDANLDLAVAGTIMAKFKGTGQTCVCSNRIYVHSDIHDEFVRRLTAAVKAFTVGPGLDPSTTHGPLISPAAVDRVAQLVDDAVSRGADIVIGGKRIPTLGANFFQPTILVKVSDDFPICQTEIFGPVAPILRFTSEDEVITSANTAEVGLASYLFTRNLHRAARMTEKLQFGMVSLNTPAIPDAASPFGGIKQSGLGREGSKYGIEDYLELKTVVSGGHDVPS